MEKFDMSKHGRYVCDRRVHLLKEYTNLQFGGLFRGRTYGHILAKKEDVVRLLLDARMQSATACKALFGGSLRFQRCAHHVNSSQIMCLNFFGPQLLTRENILKDILCKVGIALKGRILCADEGYSQFEYQPTLSGDRTNFDLRICTDEDEEIFVEAKYTENEFGKPSKGSLKDSEWKFYSQLCEKSLYLKGISREAFYSDFQVNRNIAHVANHKQYCVFFVPRSNPSLRFPNLNGMRNVFVLYAEDFAGLVDRCADHLKFKPYYHRLHEMYFG